MTLRIYIDSPPLIYLIENVGPYASILESRLAAPDIIQVCSEISRLECRVKPIRDGEDALLAAFNEQPIPSTWGTLFKSLLFLKEQYHIKWAKEIAQLPNKYLRTRPYEKHDIPPGRLIDMALWRIGKETEEEAQS